MPFDAAVMGTVVLVIFVVFAGGIAWAIRHGRNVLKDADIA
jgi:hypothetical protein